MNMDLKKFIFDMPKTDLHVHLDGSIKLTTLIELAQQQKIELPSYTVDGLEALVFKSTYADLNEYLKGFSYLTAIMQDPESLERIAYEFAWDNFNENVCYFEVRFAPFLHVNKTQNFETVINAVNNGLQRAVKEYNNSEVVLINKKPKANYGIIVCAMRAFFYGMSKYYDNLLDVHKYNKPRTVFSLASSELINATIKLRQETNIPVVAIDLAGTENGYPPIDHKEAYAQACSNFINKTVHAGEDYGPESIFQAITKLYADRIGHGFYLFDENKILKPDIIDRTKYVKQLVKYIADHRILIEICLTSNLQTSSDLTNIKDHTFSKMLEENIAVSLCTDNRTVSKTTVTNEYLLAIDHFNLKLHDIQRLCFSGFKHCFFHESYVEKRKYLKSVFDYSYSLIK